jgi:hypothetical protein
VKGIAIIMAPWKIIAALLVAGSLGATALTPDANASDMTFLDDLVLIVLEDGNIPRMHAAREQVESVGGHVAVMSPPSLLLGWVPEEARGQLVGRAGITGIYARELREGEIGSLLGEPNRAMLRYFNAVARGEIQAEEEMHIEMSNGPDRVQGAGAMPRLPDRFDPPLIDESEYLEALAGVGIDIVSLKERGLGPQGSTQEALGNSDAMTGTIACTIFFIESDGSGTDPDMNTWTIEHMQQYLDAATTALVWWASKALGNPGCAATFLLYWHSAQDPRCQQWVEPILHDTSYEDIWVKAIMSNFGYTLGTRFSRVNAFNTWQRSTYATARAFSAFIPYNPFPSAPAFPGGGTAYAWYYGPYHVCLFNTGWSKSQTFAHETGHIFGGCDEYAGGCSSCGYCTNSTNNDNCEACNPRSVNCMMKANDWQLCAYTPDHVGWGLVPCTPAPPPALPAPSVSSMSPPQLYHGLSGTLTVTGTDFYAGAWVDFGPEVFVDKLTFVNSTTIEIDVSVLNTVAPGFYDVIVRNRDFQEATLTDGLEVLPTTRHYYSPSGGDNFPYIPPIDAATSLEVAAAAGFHGDTLFVPSGTFTNFNIQLETGVLLYGGWNADFTSRDLEAGKTVLQLNGDVAIFPGAHGGGLDGFIVENGEGHSVIAPFFGAVGGGFRSLSADAIIANCEFRNNAASDGTEPGAGGAIYVEYGNVDFRNNYIHSNTATWGGGIYLYNCSGSIIGNTITGNTLSPATGTPYGGGVILVDCDGVVFEGNTITANTGAQDGGGVLVDNSTNVVFNGDLIGYNSASFLGAGVCAKKSAVECIGVDFERNNSALGAGIGASDTSAVLAQGCRFTWNTGVVGGGVYASTGTAHINHNLFVGNKTTSTGAGVYVSAVTGGAVQGNTLDRNDSGAGVAGIVVSNAAISVFDNIAVNSTGHGISGLGTTLPWVGYNLVWNSSGNDYEGVSAGDGAVTGDPVFSDTASGDYHLGAHSPAIDAGRPGAAWEDPDGSPGDVGWYGSHAHTMAQPSYPQNLAAAVQSGDVVLGWTRNLEPDVASYYIYCDTVGGFTPSASSFVASVPGPDSTVTLPAPPDSAFYVVSAIDSDGYQGGYSNEAFVGAATGAGGSVAYQNRLYQNVPNPFNPSTRIRYELREPARVTLSVFDVAGRLVRRLVSEDRPGGVHTVAWDGISDGGARVSSGVYFYKLETPGFVQTRKMLLLK